jgi:hypothetical protein
MSSNLFQKAFVHVLREAPEPVETDPTAGISDSDAMAQTLDKGTNPAEFDADAGAAADHLAAATKMHANMVVSLKTWISELEKFSKFLNGTEPDSMQSKLKNAVPATLFDKIRIAETKKIARVAMEITSLNEMLKGYLASSSDNKYRGI